MNLTDFDFEPKVYPIVNTKYRTIQTKIPVPESISFFERVEKYEPRSMHGALPILWDKAEGFQLSDAWGNKWIDFTSTIFVANAGHANTRIIDTLKQQLDKPLIHAYNYLTKIRADYLEFLINSTPEQFQKAYLVSTGSEATEAALKLMRMYSKRKNPSKLGIICFEGNYHGRTMGSQMMSYSPEAKEWIGYHDPNIFHIPFPYPWDKKANANPKDFFHDSIKQLIEKHSLNPLTDLSGFMIESFQGWCSVFYPNEYLKALEEYAYENEMLVCFDEMQAGFGRTGKLFGYMHYDVEPDLICCGKGVSSGFPLGVVLGPKRILDVPSVGSMSSTNSANPLACAAGLANLKVIIEENLIEQAEILGNIFHQKLNEIKIRYGDYISHIFGKGLVAAVHFNKVNKPLVELTNKICVECMGRGLLVVRTGRESIKLGPPLCISEEALLEGLDVLDESISTIIEHIN